MAVEIGALRAMLSLDSAAFDKGAKRAKASMNGLQRSLTNAADKMKSVGRAMTTRVTAPLALAAGAAVRSSLKTVDAQAKMAQSLDTTVVSIQNLTRASDLAGISQEDLNGSLRRMTRRISLAEDGTGAAVDAFERLNLSASDLADLPVDKRVEIITRRIREMIPEAEQAGVASKVFGDKTGLAIMRLDSDVIAQATEEIRKFGVGVSDVDADKIEAANDAMSSIGLVTRGLSNQLTVALAPVLETVAKRIAEVAGWFSDLSPRMQRLVGVSVAVAAAIGPLAIALGFVAAGMAAMASPIGLAVLAFGAVAGAAAYVATQWDKLKDRFPVLERIAGLGAEIKKNWENLPAIKWALLIPALRWAKFIPGLRWAAFIPKLSWAALKVIPGIGWVALAGSLAWSVLVKKIEWNGWIPKVHWADWIPTIVWSDFIPDIDWGAIFNSGGRLHEQGRRLGRDLGAGISGGLMTTLPSSETDVRGYLNSLEGAARAESETQSPSKVWMRIGQDLMDGLGLGIEARAQNAAESAAAAAQRVSDAAGAASPALGLLPDQISDAANATSGLNNRLAGMFSSALRGAKSFSDFLSNIVTQLGDMLINSAFQSLFSGLGGGGGGGFWSSLFGGIGSNATGTNNWRGGLTSVNERGGEIMNLPRGTQIIPHDISKRMADGGGGGAQTMNFNINVDGANGDQHVIDLVGQGVREGLGQYDRQLPGRVKQINRDPRRK